MKTRLIIVEGLPGSGKSTLAKRIADCLQKNGKSVVCVDEGDINHPADYTDYDFPDFETERRLILEKWRKFVAGAKKDVVYVFNCIFLQNPMCETMMRFDMDEDSSKNYVIEIENIIKAMNPFIIYIDTPSVKETIDGVLSERGKDWLNAVIDYHLSQGYGKRNNLHGYDGYIKCLEERRLREINILKVLTVNCFTVGRNVDLSTIKNIF